MLQRFGQYGVVKPGEDGAPRVKIYKDRNTQLPKGDGLVTFLYEPSVSHWLLGNIFLCGIIPLCMQVSLMTGNNASRAVKN